MKFYLKGKKITKQAAKELLGEKTLTQRIQDAKESYQEDPQQLINWMDGFEIRF